MTLLETLLMEYAALVGALMMFASIHRQPPDLKIPYSLFATAGLLIAIRNHMQLTLGAEVSASYQVIISTLSNVAMIEAIVLLLFHLAAPPKQLTGWMGRGAGYAVKSGAMSALAGSAAYLAVAKQADAGISFVVASAFSVLVIGRLARKPAFAVVALAVCLTTWSVLQKSPYEHSLIQDDLRRLAYLGSCALLALL